MGKAHRILAALLLCLAGISPEAQGFSLLRYFSRLTNVTESSSVSNSYCPSREHGMWSKIFWGTACGIGVAATLWKLWQYRHKRRDPTDTATYKIPQAIEGPNSKKK